MALGRALAAALALSLAALGPLFLGAQAGDCKGQRQVLREAPGFVTDGAGNYSWRASEGRGRQARQF